MPPDCRTCSGAWARRAAVGLSRPMCSTRCHCQRCARCWPPARAVRSTEPRWRGRRTAGFAHFANCPRGDSRGQLSGCALVGGRKLMGSHVCAGTSTGRRRANLICVISAALRTHYLEMPSLAVWHVDCGRVTGLGRVQGGSFTGASRAAVVTRSAGASRLEWHTRWAMAPSPIAPMRVPQVARLGARGERLAADRRVPV